MDKTLLKGLKVLEAVTDVTHPSRTIDEVATRLGLTRSNAHRTLQTLMYAGYIERDKDTGYRGGIRLFELAARQRGSLDLRRIAAPSLRKLAANTGETVHLSVLDGIEVVYIDKIDSPQPIRAYSMIGGRAPAYAVATGKALLAYQPEGYLDTYADQLGQHSRSTLTTLPKLKEELRRAVRAGYAINRGEWRDGVGGIAVAIFNALDDVVGAIGVSGPIDRLSLARSKKLASEVKACAAEISAALGHQSP